MDSKLGASNRLYRISDVIELGSKKSSANPGSIISQLNEIYGDDSDVAKVLSKMLGKYSSDQKEDIVVRKIILKKSDRVPNEVEEEEDKSDL